MKEIESKRGSRLICYLTSDRQNALAMVARDVVQLFFNQLRRLSERKSQQNKIDVLIFTVGGDSLAAFGLARLVREFAGWVGVLVPDKCLSAGTLFALGGNEIFMTKAGTLSPIDPTVQTPYNPWVEGPAPGQRQQGPVSVESVAGFKDLVTSELGWGIQEGELVTQAFKMLAEKVHPLALGDVFRRRQQIEWLAEKLLLKHRKDADKIKEIIAKLTRGLGSHDYPISRTEAREIFGDVQIAPDNPDIEELVWKLFLDYSKDLQLGTPYNAAILFNQLRGTQADKNGRVPVEQKLAVIETTEVRDVFEQRVLLGELQVQPGGPLGAIKGVQQEVVELGWKSYSK